MNGQNLRETLVDEMTLDKLCDENDFKGFLGEIYQSVISRTKKQMDYYLFNEVLQLPLFISEKIFMVFSGRGIVLTKQGFCDGLDTLYYGSRNQLIDMFFHICDFDNDSLINVDDVRLFTIHLHSTLHNSKTLKYATDIVDSFFENEKQKDINEFRWKCNNQNYDIIMLFSYLIHSRKFFNEEQILYYVNIRNIKVNTSNLDVIVNKRRDSFSYVHLSKKLYDYVQLPILPRSERSSSKEVAAIPEGSELEELQTFESELEETMMSNMDPLSLQDGSSSDDYDNLAAKNTSGVSRLSSFFLTHTCKQRAFSFYASNSPEKTKRESETEIPSAKNEIHLFSISKNETLMNVKLVLVSNVLFLFIFNQEYKKYVFYKILYLGSTFPQIKHKIQIQDQIYFGFHFVSTFHGVKSTISFYGKNEDELKRYCEYIEETLCIRKIENFYDISTELGRGKFGVVKAATSLSSDKKYAVKTVNKNEKNSTEEDYKIIQWEKSIFLFLKENRHPNVIKCYDYFETGENMYFVFENAAGGDLKTFVKSNQMDSQTLISFSFQIMNGLNFLQSNGIIHRDIKHTNILITKSNIIKIIDFGLSRVMGYSEQSNSPYGSLSFKAPEVIKGGFYNFKIDVWSAGITIYFLLFRDIPFNEKNRTKLKEKILNENFSFPSFKERLKGNYDYSFVYSLISDCLIKDVNKRPDCKTIMKRYFENFSTSVE